MNRLGWVVGSPLLVAVLLVGACSADPQPTYSPSRTTAVSALEGSRWHPERGLTWQWQLSDEPIDLTVDAQVYDIDLFNNSAATVQALHQRGRRVICYLSAGSWEPYRPDSANFPPEVMGGPVAGWPDERWLDVRRVEVLRPLMTARLDLCQAKGFDGVEPDWLDNHMQDTGFPLTSADQLRYNRMLADLAHERGLAIGLKNDLGQVDELAELFDFAVVEQCAEFDECGALRSFLDRGKPVFHAEYHLARDEFCPVARSLGLSSIRKRIELDAWREVC
jgi:hypothetical protein